MRGIICIVTFALLFGTIAFAGRVKYSDISSEPDEWEDADYEERDK